MNEEIDAVINPQQRLNESFDKQLTQQHRFVVELSDSVARAWGMLGRLWLFAAGGWVLGCAAIVVAVIK